jgi:hypothetical protein
MKSWAMPLAERRYLRVLECRVWGLEKEYMRVSVRIAGVKGVVPPGFVFQHHKVGGL